MRAASISLLRHGAFELFEALHLALGDGQLRFEFGEAFWLPRSMAPPLIGRR